MFVTRRDFVKYCSASAAALGLGMDGLGKLEAAVTGPGKPPVIWLQGSGCTGCSVSFLNRFTPSAPQSVADILISKINLAYHPNVMAAAGDLAVSAAEQAFNTGRYILIVEGGVPAAFGGAACWAWTLDGQDVTFLEAVTGLAGRAVHVLAVGTCACYGGMSAAGPNPTGVTGVSQVTGRPVVNIPGCPPHPDWIVWGLVQILLGLPVDLDQAGRPVVLYSAKVHDHCPRREAEEAEIFGVDRSCLEELGCRGPECYASCPATGWNNGANWCVDANVPCHNCTAPGFPFTSLLKS